MYHIVICDDEPSLISEIRENLEHYAAQAPLSFRIQTYCDRKDLPEHYEDKFNLIFMDIRMRQMDCLRTAEEIRRRDWETGIIILTSAAQYVWRGYEFGATCSNH